MRIGLCAPSSVFTREDAARVDTLAAVNFPLAELVWHPQCFESHGHFAGDDATRLAAFVELANDPEIDAVWFARGGYGAARIAGDAIPLLGEAARTKTYLGYSDAGNLLAALYRAGIGHCVHGSLSADVKRVGGDQVVLRALRWLVQRDASTLEPSLTPGVPHVAFNLLTLSMLIGTPLLPDLAGHILLIEDVSEHKYAIDRALFHVTTALAHAGLAGIRLGRFSEIPENDRPFGHSVEDCARHWCAKNNIAFLGHADIGHDIHNKIVPFGMMRSG